MAPKTIEDSSWVQKARKGYEEGASDVEICRLIGITKQTFDNYYSTNPSFKKFVEMGRTLSAAWWHSQGRLNLDNRAFNTSLWTFNMKNRFGWAEKSENSTAIPLDDLSEDQVRAQYQRLKAKFERHTGKTEAQLLESTSGPHSATH